MHGTVGEHVVRPVDLYRDPVSALVEVARDVLPASFEDWGSVPLDAQVVGAQDKDVATGTTGQDVVISIPDEDVIALAAEQPILVALEAGQAHASTADQDVVASASAQQIVAQFPIGQAGPGGAGKSIVACRTIHPFASDMVFPLG